jgi:hypothetical protein
VFICGLSLKKVLQGPIERDRKHYKFAEEPRKLLILTYMKKTVGTITSGISLAAALLLSAATTQANLLIDPGFESGAPGQPNPIPLPGGAGGGWAVFNGATFSTAHPESGNWGMQEIQNANQAWNFQAPYQVIGGVSAGEQFTLTADYMTPTGISQTTAFNPVFIQLTFFNAAGTDIGTVETGGNGAKANTYTPAALNTWFNVSVTATAPANAAYVAPYLAFMENGSQTAPDALYWDNASLVSVVPEPSCLALLSLGVLGTLIWRRR